MEPRAATACDVPLTLKIRRLRRYIEGSRAIEEPQGVHHVP